MTIDIASPLALPCGASIRNRLCKAALTEGLADPMNRATARHERLYRAWSEGGAGLVITGNVQVDVRVLDSFGRESKKFANVGLDGGNPFVQLNSGDLFSGFSTDDGSRATIIIDNPRGTAFLGAYATVIDQRSGDATFVAGQPAP